MKKFIKRYPRAIIHPNKTRLGWVMHILHTPWDFAHYENMQAVDVDRHRLHQTAQALVDHYRGEAS